MDATVLGGLIIAITQLAVGAVAWLARDARRARARVKRLQRENDEMAQEFFRFRRWAAQHAADDLPSIPAIFDMREEEPNASHNAA